MTAPSTSTPCLLPQAHAPPTPTIAFASPPPSAPTRVVRPTTLQPVFVAQQDARLLVATIATSPTTNAVRHSTLHGSQSATTPMVLLLTPHYVPVVLPHALPT